MHNGLCESGPETGCADLRADGNGQVFGVQTCKKDQKGSKGNNGNNGNINIERYEKRMGVA